MKLSAFVKKDTISIDIFVSEKDGQRFVWLYGSDSPDNNGSESVLYNFCFRWPSWKDEVFIESESVEVIDGRIKLLPSMLRYARFSRLIKSWSVTDESGNILPVDVENIANLDPDIANCVMERLDDILGKN